MNVDPEFVNRKRFAMDTYKDNTNGSSYIVVAGGFHTSHERGESCIQSAFLFDIQKRQCIALPDIPITDYYDIGGAVLKNEYFYLIIGSADDRDHHWITSYKVYRIRLTTTSSNKNNAKWEQLNPNRMYGCSLLKVISNGKSLFLMGRFQILKQETSGWYYAASKIQSHLFLHQLVEYQPDENKFQALPSLPYLLSLPTPPLRPSLRTAVVVRQKIYVFGYDLGLFVEIYDLSSQSWSEDHDRRCPKFHKKGFTYPIAYSMGHWIVLRDSRSICRILYDTYKHTWIMEEEGEEVSVQTEPIHVAFPEDFRVFGSIAVRNDTRLALFWGRERERNHILFWIHRKYVIPNWYIIKDFILLRKLLDHDRAHIVLTSNNKENLILQQLFTSLHFDIFMVILTFL